MNQRDLSLLVSVLAEYIDNKSRFEQFHLPLSHMHHELKAENGRNVQMCYKNEAYEAIFTFATHRLDWPNKIVAIGHGSFQYSDF